MFKNCRAQRQKCLSSSVLGVLGGALSLRVFGGAGLKGSGVQGVRGVVVLVEFWVTRWCLPGLSRNQNPAC